MVEQSMLKCVRQIGYAVRDVEAAIKAYQALGGGDGEPQIFEVTLDAANGYRYRGEPASCTLKIGVIKAGGMDFEFIQCLQGRHPSGDYVAQHGEGLNHLGVYIDDLAAWKQKALASGARVVIEGSFAVSADRKGQYAYVEMAPGAYPQYELLQL